MYASEMGITRINEPWKTIALLLKVNILARTSQPIPISPKAIP